MLLGKGPSAVAGTMLNTLTTEGLESLLQDVAKDPLNAIKKIYNFLSSSAGVGTVTLATMTAAYPLVQQLVNAQYGEKILPDIGIANQAHEYILGQLPTSIAEMLSPTKDQQQKQ